MNSFIQNTLAITTLVIAIAFLVVKFIWNPKKNSPKNCGGNSNCGCH